MKGKGEGGLRGEGAGRKILGKTVLGGGCGPSYQQHRKTIPGGGICHAFRQAMQSDGRSDHGCRQESAEKSYGEFE